MNFFTLMALTIYALCFVVAFIATAIYCDLDGGDKWYEPGGFTCCVVAGIFSPLMVAIIAVVWLLVVVANILNTRWRHLTYRPR